MLRKSLSAFLLSFMISNSVWAQGWFPSGGYCPPPPNCAVPQYTQVPVTEMRECRQVIHRPRVETEWREVPVTEYRPVTETKVAQVPTVQYQTVTEYRQRTRDCGRWMVNYRCRPRISACDYDSRPDLLGALNRTGYNIRMAFTPQVYAERNWVPNIVTENIPVQRTVAIPGSRQVSYQVTRMVAHTTTKRVAVNRVRMVAEEVVTKQPVTVMHTVPYGSAYAFGPTSVGTGTAIKPIPDSISASRDPKDPTPIRKRGTNRPSPRINEAESFKEESTDDTRSTEGSTKSRSSSLTRPGLDEIEDNDINKPRSKTEPPTADNFRSGSVPSAIRVSAWVARRHTSQKTPSAKSTRQLAAKDEE